jgi:serine/threonine protein kinase
VDSDNNVYLVDFGIAKQIGIPREHAISVTGMIIGTPAYMSPEQARGIFVVLMKQPMYIPSGLRYII